MNKTSSELDVDTRNFQYVMMDRPAEDEISLIDLWLVLVKRKKVLLSIILLSLVVGFLVAFFLPVKYEYSTSIEIGTRPVDGQNEVPIEPIQSVLAKLQDAYIPLAISSYQTDFAGKIKVIDIKANVAKGSNIIRLSVTGVERDEKIYIRLLNEVVEKIKFDHKRVSSLVESDLQLGIKKQENIIAKLVNELLLMQSQMKRLDKKEQLLNKRIDSLSEFVGSNEKLRQSAAKSNDATLTLMMLDNELRSGRELLAKLEDQSYIYLANEREVLRNEMAANEKNQLQNRQVIERFKSRLANLLETRAIVKPLKSLTPVGTSKKLILILFLVVGFIVALITAFFVEFLDKVKATRLEN